MSQTTNLGQSDEVVHPLERLKSDIRPKNRQGWDAGFRVFCILTAFCSIVILAILLVSIFVQGYGSLSKHFLFHYPEPIAAEAGFGPAIWGTVWVCVTCALLALPIGVATAIFLEEFKPKSFLLRQFHAFIQLNISNLAGVPSVVYGILGLTVFVSMVGLFDEKPVSIGAKYYDQFFTEGKKSLRVPISDPVAPATVAESGLQAYNSDGELVTPLVVKSRREARRLPPEKKEYALIQGRKAGRDYEGLWYHFRLPFGRSVLAGALTLMLVILPIVIIATQEAIRGVPVSLREAGMGLGATQWQIVRRITLPASIPGIMTGSILAISRAIGEAAPILILAGAIFITSNPSNLMDNFTVMPLQIYDWAGRPQKDFHDLAAAGIIVLLAILLTFNLSAVLIRQFTQKDLS